QIAFAFEKIQTTNQAPNVISTKTNKVTVANTTNTQSNLEAFNESSVGISARFISIKAPVVYEMGSIDNPYGSEQLHKVRLTNSFEIQATEVTQYQWYLVMKDSSELFAVPSGFNS